MRFLILALFLCAVAPLTARAEEVPTSQAYELGMAAKDKFDALPKEQQEAILEQAKQKWAAMDAEAKQKLAAKAEATYNALPQETQDKMKMDAAQKWQSMSIEDKNKFRSAFSDVLGDKLKAPSGNK